MSSGVGSARASERRSLKVVNIIHTLGLGARLLRVDRSLARNRLIWSRLAQFLAAASNSGATPANFGRNLARTRPSLGDLGHFGGKRDVCLHEANLAKSGPTSTAISI